MNIITIRPISTQFCQLGTWERHSGCCDVCVCVCQQLDWNFVLTEGWRYCYYSHNLLVSPWTFQDDTSRFWLFTSQAYSWKCPQGSSTFLAHSSNPFCVESGSTRHALPLMGALLRLTGTNHCANATCSHGCLLTPRNFSCYCPLGMRLDEGGQSCTGGSDSSPLRTEQLCSTIYWHREV